MPEYGVFLPFFSHIRTEPTGNEKIRIRENHQSGIFAQCQCRVATIHISLNTEETTVNRTTLLYYTFLGLFQKIRYKEKGVKTAQIAIEFYENQ